MSAAPLTGADAVLATAASAGIEFCFANPGTTEMPLVAAFGRQQAIRPVLCLFEGVCSGAADGYARIAGKPALTLTHLGPGFANAVANLHNARRGRSPIVNLVGEHTTAHLPYDAPLASDIAALARSVSAYVATTGSAADVAGKAREAISAACIPPGQIATVILPMDHQLGDAGPVPQYTGVHHALPCVPDSQVDGVAARLSGATQPLILLGGSGLTSRGQRAAQRIAKRCGARLISETFPSISDRGGGLPSVPRLPYFPEPAIALLAAHTPVVLAGAREPVSFFGYAGLPSALAAPGTTVALAGPTEDAADALDRLADLLKAPMSAESHIDAPAAVSAAAALTPDGVAAALVPRIPDGAVVVVEGGTLGYPYFGSAAAARPHRAICLSGGSIGFAVPAALGAALANERRPVIALTGDGAAAYTSQALWSIAREGLPVIVCVAANRTYNIVRTELQRAGVAVEGRIAALTGLGDPPLDWVALARGYGADGIRTTTGGELSAALDRALQAKAPSLIEIAL